MAKLTFNSVVYIKSTLEKVYIRAIITRGQSKKYKLSNGMTVNRDDLLDDMPVVAPEPSPADTIPAGEPLPAGEPAPDIRNPAPAPKSKQKKTDKC